MNTFTEKLVDDARKAVHADNFDSLRRLNATIRHQESLVEIAKVFLALCNTGQIKSVKTRALAELVLNDIEGKA